MAKKQETTTVPDLDPVDQWAAREVAAAKPADCPKGIDEAEIIGKVRVGLTRQQAIDVILGQRAHDAALEKSEGSK